MNESLEEPSAAARLRPSSVRRLRALRLMVAAFGEGDMGRADVALLLGCSPSAARNYVSELLDAGVIAPHPVRQAAGADRRLYRRTADAVALRHYLAALGSSAISADEPCLPAQRTAADFTFDGAARRDPLVAALFGAVCV